MRALFVIAGIVAGCSTSTSTASDVARDAGDGGYTGPRSPCSTGAPYAFESTFPAVDDASMLKAPECIPRCGVGGPMSVAPFGQAYPLRALPNGACNHEGDVCAMTALREKVCPNGDTTYCSLTGYSCRCESSGWRCYQGPQGASACVCDLDAGAQDAATD